MTRSREMWAPRGWPDDVGERVEVWADGQRAPFDPTPVRVTDISDEPQFSNGDRVQHAAGSVGTVLSPPFHDDLFERWYVAVRASAGVFVWPCSNLTKLPRTKTVTPSYSIQGDSDKVVTALWKLDSYVAGLNQDADLTVHVLERVEEDS